MCADFAATAPGLKLAVGSVGAVPLTDPGSRPAIPGAAPIDCSAAATLGRKSRLSEAPAREDQALPAAEPDVHSGRGDA